MFVFHPTPPHHHQVICEALTPKVTVFGDRAGKEVIKVKQGHSCNALI